MLAILLAVAFAGCDSPSGETSRDERGVPADRAGRSESAGHESSAALVATAEDRGVFATPCAYSHSAPDDPIVHAGHAGMSHRHDFFGATTTSAESDAESLLAGETTCRTQADRAAYWAPSLLSDGVPVQPTELLAYYQVPLGADARQVEVPPNGLEMIAGDAKSTTAQDLDVVSWRCGEQGELSPVPTRCPPGADLRLRLVYDPCWDGEDLDSPDHVSHLARLGEDGTCPGSHPVMVPELTVDIVYPLSAMDGVGELTLASGPITGGHGDALIAWEEEHIAREVDVCLRANRDCYVPANTGLPFDELESALSQG